MKIIIENLKKEQGFLEDPKVEKTFVKNLTDVVIPDNVLIILDLGPKFAFKPRIIPTPDIITDIEFIIKCYAPEPIKNAVRNQLLYSVTKHTKTKRKLNRIDKFLNRGIKETAKFLKTNKDLFASCSDKGGVTIIARRDEHLYRK